ncbi:MAG: recombinase family protein [Sulfitobacter sp.]
MKQYVIYRRVSTKGQGESGLGLEAQDRDIQLFLENYSGTPYEVLGSFTDVISGKYASRPELDKALALARSTGAELLIAKLDRISRKVSQIATLMEDTKLTIRVAAMPNADAFQLHIYASLAEQERKMISLRTKAALQAAKARGVKLGGYREGHQQRVEAIKDAADAAANKVASIITPMRSSGSTFQQIADALNAANVPTPRGRQWQPTSVKNALTRLAA